MRPMCHTGTCRCADPGQKKEKEADGGRRRHQHGDRRRRSGVELIEQVAAGRSAKCEVVRISGANIGVLLSTSSICFMSFPKIKTLALCARGALVRKGRLIQAD